MGHEEGNETPRPGSLPTQRIQFGERGDRGSESRTPGESGSLKKEELREKDWERHRERRSQETATAACRQHDGIGDPWTARRLSSGVGTGRANGTARRAERLSLTQEGELSPFVSIRHEKWPGKKRRRTEKAPSW